MASAARRRLLRDMQKITTEHDEGFQAVPCQDNILIWKAVIFGPEDTIWEGGIFKLDIECTEDYPKCAPKIVFRTPVYHPNIYKDGNICLDILGKEWTNAYDVSAVLKSIRSLLSDPNPNSPANTQAASCFKENKKLYNQKVRDSVELSWTV